MSGANENAGARSVVPTPLEQEQICQYAEENPTVRWTDIGSKLSLVDALV